MALILSAAGLYGLLSFLVSQRNRELGVRMALGALPADVLWMIVGKGLRLTAAGLIPGVLLAFGLARLISALTYGISSSDPLSFLAGASVLLLVALPASYLPARRAMRLDPVEVLRSE